MRDGERPCPAIIPCTARHSPLRKASAAARTALTSPRSGATSFHETVEIDLGKHPFGRHGLWLNRVEAAAKLCRTGPLTHGFCLVRSDCLQGSRRLVEPRQCKGILAMTCLLALMGLFWIGMPAVVLLWFLSAILRDARHRSRPRPWLNHLLSSPFRPGDPSTRTALQDPYGARKRRMPASH